jgi:hypothetical protein
MKGREGRMEFELRETERVVLEQPGLARLRGAASSSTPAYHHPCAAAHDIQRKWI